MLRLIGKLVLVSFAMVQASACQNSSDRKISLNAMERFEVQIVDNPESQDFSITIESKDSRPVCFLEDDLPTEAGVLLVERREVALLSKELRFDADAKFQSLFCPGGCGEVRLMPNEKAKFHLKYAAFGIPSEIQNLPNKKLVFPLTGYFCRRKK